MPVGLPKEDIEEQIRKLCENTIYSFVGWVEPFKGVRTKFNYMCEIHGEQTIRVEHFVKLNVRCRKCFNRRQSFSAEERENFFRLKCKNTPYTFVKWVNFDGTNKSRVVFNCLKHGEWETKVAVFVSGSRCKKCGQDESSQKQRYSISLRTLEAQRLCEEKGYIFKRWKTKYENARSLMVCSCPIHGQWESVFNNFRNGDGCPGCARKGFNTSKKSHLYCLISNDGNYVKIGITNDLKRRMRQLKNATPFDFSLVDSFTHQTGHEIRKIEKIFHHNFKSANLSGFQGCTEWLKFEPVILQYFNSLHTANAPIPALFRSL